MMRRLATLIDNLVYGHASLAWLPSLGIAVLLLLSEPARASLPLQISATQRGFYSTIAGLGATLLGLLMAVIALLAALPEHDRPLVRKIREQGLLERSVRQAGRACFAMGMMTVAAVLGLLVDMPPEQAVPEASHLGSGAYWVWVVVIAAIPAALLIASSTTTVIRSMILATSKPE